MGLGLENPLHIAIVVLIVLLLFGAKRLPEVGRGIGTGMREFKDSLTGATAHPELADSKDDMRSVSDHPA